MSLDLIRNKHSWFTKGVLIVIAVTFVLGIGYNLADWGAITHVPSQTAAEVNGEPISLISFNMYREGLKRQLNQEGGELPEQYATQIDGIALSQLINLKLMSQKARDLGFNVTDDDLSDAIHSDPAFQSEGRFVGKEQYEQIIRKYFNQDVGEFENAYRDEILARKLSNFIEETAVVTDDEIYNVFKKENDKVNLYYIAFPAEDFGDEYSPTEEEIAEYYENNKGQLKTPELREIRHIVLGAENFGQNLNVTDEEIASYYEAYSEEFLSEEGEPLPFEDVKGEIEANLKNGRGEALRQEFLASLENPEEEGKTIDSIAEEFSVTINESEPVSARESLNLVPPAVARQIFSMEKGRTTIIPVGTALWVTELKEVIPPREKTLEEAREDITAALKSEKSKELARSKANETLEKLKTVKSDRIKAEAEKLGLEVKETGYFSRVETIPDINVNELREEAFELDEGSGVSDKIHANRDKFYIVALKEKQDAKSEEFELKREELRELELAKQRSEIIRNWLQDMRRQAEIIPNSDLFPAQG
ncbi:MAG: SurA N-terminal domain-containing protein [Deltaproteobacteria bacterium]